MINRNKFYISCPIDTYSGYGARSRDFVKAVIELDKYDVKVLPQRWGNTPFGFIDNNPEWEFLRNYVLWNVPPGQVPEKPDIWCQITVPNEFTPIGHYNIGVTAGIETTICHNSWIEGCNRMDINLVSSNHSKKVFEDSKFFKDDPKTGQRLGELKLEKPMEVLLEGVDLDLYRPIPETELESKKLLKDINSIPENFAYLVVGHWMQGDLGQDRKNIGLTIRAFYELFKNKRKRPALILKTSMVGSSYMDRREILRRIDQIKKGLGPGDYPSVYLLHGEFTNKEMAELYNHPKVKAMISLTKGEGFGRPLLEFSLCNKPIMASGWSGQVDFLKPEFTGLIAGKLTPVHPTAHVKDMILKESNWYSPDINGIGYFMTNIFECYKDWSVKAKRQGYYSRTNFSFENMKNKLSDILDNNIKHLPTNEELKLPKLSKLSKSTKDLELPKLKKA
jgi:hypothetical protein